MKLTYIIALVALTGCATTDIRNDNSIYMTERLAVYNQLLNTCEAMPSRDKERFNQVIKDMNDIALSRGQDPQRLKDAVTRTQQSLPVNNFKELTCSTYLSRLQGGELFVAKLRSGESPKDREYPSGTTLGIAQDTATYTYLADICPNLSSNQIARLKEVAKDLNKASASLYSEHESIEKTYNDSLKILNTKFPNLQQENVCSHIPLMEAEKLVTEFKPISTAPLYQAPKPGTVLAKAADSAKYTLLQKRCVNIPGQDLIRLHLTVHELHLLWSKKGESIANIEAAHNAALEDLIDKTSIEQLQQSCSHYTETLEAGEKESFQRTPKKKPAKIKSQT